ncbi:MAG: exodeoxyribonuclease I [Desulfobacterales bacterium]|nr:MAG: exodeoxyribonuclease I [Desulfobacterales bacterium]
MTTYLFYDTETTGLNKAFDQVLQFAAIRSDMQFKEIERTSVRIRLRPDVIPSPQAIITNRISVADFGSGVNEFEAIQQIHQLLNQPGTISLGYNTMGFDDEFLRFAFHRNLLPPYTHQFHNGCRRMDLLPITIICWLYKRAVLQWPEIDGKPSLKLEHLSTANRLVSGPSHDAGVDVAATLELARKLASEKKMWDYLAGYFIKETDARRLEELPVSFQSVTGAHRLGLMVGSEFGFQQDFQVPVLFIGNSLPYPNQTLWLCLDRPDLPATTSTRPDEKTWVIRKKLGEPGIVLPPHKRFWRQLGAPRRAIAEENLNWLQARPEILQALVKYYREYRYPLVPNVDLDAALYQIGFLSRFEEKLCRQFHAASWDERFELVDLFPNPETRALARRILFRNYYDNLPPTRLAEFEAYMRRVNPARAQDALVDHRGERRTTPAEALGEIEQLRQTGELDHFQRRLLDELQDYILKNFSQKPIIG